MSSPCHLDQIIAPVAIERSANHCHGHLQEFLNHGYLQEFRGRALLSAAEAGQRRGRRRAFTNVAEAGPRGSEANEAEKNLCVPRAFPEGREKGRASGKIGWRLCPAKDDDFINVAEAGPRGSKADEAETISCVPRAFP